MPKPEFEFFHADSVPFTVCEGAVPDLTERVIARDDEGGVATRILRFAPGTDTSPNGAQVHDFWEEVYILEGSIHDLELDETFSAGMYACRPPGMRHGPWSSPDGCLTFEVRYAPPADGERG
jgi:ChrR Cupin-like domain